MKQLLAILLCAFVLVSCAKQPTQFTSVVDSSPTANFKAMDTTGMTLFVDGVNYGSLDQYVYPERAVTLIPGQHVIQIRKNDVVVFTEDVYFSEATHRTIEID